MKQKLFFTALVAGALSLGHLAHAQTNAPFLMIVATDPTALEGTSTGSFTLIRNGSASNALTVNLDFSGSASNGVDYALINSSITIPAGYLALDIPVQPLVDTNNRGNKTVTLKIETNSNYQLGGDHRATVTIIDDVFNTPNPTVSLTSPTNDSSFGFPASINLAADASDPGSPITSVSFFANDDLVARITNAPYTFTWTNGHPGHYTLFARAVDSINQSALSAPVQITITDILPAVQITSPTNGQNFSAHQNIPLDATVTDANSAATIASVTFYANGRNVGTATNAPFEVVWNNAPAGLYRLQAIATDNGGQRGISKPVSINVSRPPH